MIDYISIHYKKMQIILKFGLKQKKKERKISFFPRLEGGDLQQQSFPS